MTNLIPDNYTRCCGKLSDRDYVVFFNPLDRCAGLFDCESMIAFKSVNEHTLSATAAQGVQEIIDAK